MVSELAEFKVGGAVLFENGFRQLSSKSKPVPFNHVNVQGPHQNPSLR